MSHVIDLGRFLRESGGAILAANKVGAVVLWDPAEEEMFATSD